MTGCYRLLSVKILCPCSCPCGLGQDLTINFQQEVILCSATSYLYMNEKVLFL